MPSFSYQTVLLKRWLTVVLVTLATLLVTVATTLSITPKYTAYTQLFFAVRSGNTVTDLAQGSAFTEQQMRSYSVVTTSPIVLQRVITQLGLATTPMELGKSVKAEAAAGTVILRISVSNADPVTAQKIANAIAKQVVSVAGDLVPDNSSGKPAVRATLLAEATVPVQASSPKLSLNVGVGLLLGLVLGVAAAVTRDALDTRIRNEHDLAAVSRGSLLGVVPLAPHASPDSVGTPGAWAQAVLRLQVNLESGAARGQAGPIVVTSALEQEGKSTTAINLAGSAADTGLRVLLIDADLRQPSLANYLGLDNRVGVSSVLTEGVDPTTIIQSWGDGAVHVLAGGPAVPNTSELLASRPMASLLQRLTQSYDLVLVDSPPVLQVPDAVIMGRLARGIVVVVGSQLRRAQLRASLDALAAVEVKLLGLVLNKAARRRSSARLHRSRLLEWDEQVLPPPTSEPTHLSTSEQTKEKARRKLSAAPDH